MAKTIDIHINSNNVRYVFSIKDIVFMSFDGALKIYLNKNTIMIPCSKEDADAIMDGWINNAK